MTRHCRVAGIALAGLLAVVLAVPALGQLPTSYFDRPIPMGVSVSNTPSLPYIYAGTAGMLVTNGSNKYILSNNHVLGAIGPKLCPDTAPVGTWALQPGTLDIGTDPGQDPYYQVGTLAKTVKFIKGPKAKNLVDAAMSLTTSALSSTTILGVGVPSAGLATPAVGLVVTKSGRTTGVTLGTVRTINVTVRVSYGSSCGIYNFVKQVEIVGTSGTFSSAGDSGSAILTNSTKTPVGLLFAGSSTSTLANDIANVYSALGVTVATSAAVAPAEAFLAQAPPNPQQARLEAIQERIQDRMLNIPSVVGMGIGSDGSGLVFRVFVSKRPAAAAIPAAIDGVKVVVEESGEFRAF